MATTNASVSPAGWVAAPREVAHVIPDSWHAYAVVFGATCVMAGIYWDISWHMSIGRDTFWTPAHLMVQAGGLIAGVTSGIVALRTTFRGTPDQRAESVSFWGFRAPLGAWVCVWGCGAMLTSAPFDNWWHDAYGLDVRIISPPHLVLAFGIMSIVMGALLLTLARQNRAEGKERRIFEALFAYSAGLLLMNVAIMLTQYSGKTLMHTGLFYRVSAMFYPVVLLAAARGSRVRWPATAAAAAFTAVMLILMWTITLFPATPRLGPIYQHVGHMVTLDFPLLLIAPAIAIDLVMRRWGARLPDVVLAPVLGAAFLAAFLAVQWPFASFLITGASRNWLFNGANYVYWQSNGSVAHTYAFADFGPGAAPLPGQLGIALLFASVACFVGLAWGRWMARVRR